MAINTKEKLIYEELTYEIIGCFYDVYNTIGGGLKEKNYQKALVIALKNKNLIVREQAYFPIKYKDNKVGSCFFDLLVDGKIVLELKTTSNFKKQDIDQLFSYLKLAKLKLGVIVNFTANGVRFKRIANIKQDTSVHPCLPAGRR